MINDLLHYYIYMHKNKINGKIYIGCTTQKDIRDRWKNGKAYKTCTYFNRAIKKYGWDNFEHIILEEGDANIKYIYDREDYWISKYNSQDHNFGYNITRGGYKSISPNALKNALEWMKNHPEFGSKRAKEMHKWQKEHPVQCAESRSKNVKLASNARKRAVVCEETGEIFESASEASRSIAGTTQSKITMCCRKQRKQCGGLHWRYAYE